MQSIIFSSCLILLEILKQKVKKIWFSRFNENEKSSKLIENCQAIVNIVVVHVCIFENKCHWAFLWTANFITEIESK